MIQYTKEADDITFNNREEHEPLTPRVVEGVGERGH